tara:strand:- start:1476 stop:2372 length:897 start_codon:yes stop_codon:yes gene_type:complete
MSVLISELQKTDPSAVIELFELQLSQSLHGATTIYRWHSGVATNATGELVLNNVTYNALPIEAEGFDYKGGKEQQLPRPTLRVSNLLSTVSAILSNVNTVTPYNNLIGGKVTRIRTLAKFLDSSNFGPGTTTYNVTVVNSSGNKFALNGVTNPTITLVKGGTYIFYQHDYSNSGHPIAFRQTDDSAYVAGVSTTGTAGSAGARTTFTVPSNAPSSLKYYCTVHGNTMGNNITISNYSNPDANASIRFPDDVYYIDRKSLENRELVEFELAAVFDLANVKIPKRQALPSIFPGIGSFHA